MTSRRRLKRPVDALVKIKHQNSLQCALVCIIHADGINEYIKAYSTLLSGRRTNSLRLDLQSFKAAQRCGIDEDKQLQ
jgi:hypothetical protein